MIMVAKSLAFFPGNLERSTNSEKRSYNQIKSLLNVFCPRRLARPPLVPPQLWRRPPRHFPRMRTAAADTTRARRRRRRRQYPRDGNYKSAIRGRRKRTGPEKRGEIKDQVSLIAAPLAETFLAEEEKKFLFFSPSLLRSTTT